MEIGVHAICFIKNSENTSMADLKMVAETYLNNQNLLDDTSAVPYIHLRRNFKYFDFFLVDALFKGSDGKLHWYITTDFELLDDGFQEIDFDDLPVWLIIGCLQHIDSMLK